MKNKKVMFQIQQNRFPRAFKQTKGGVSDRPGVGRRPPRCPSPGRARPGPAGPDRRAAGLQTIGWRGGFEVIPPTLKKHAGTKALAGPKL